jgi:hypothetical protein
VKKQGIFSIEKNYGAFNRGTLVRFLRNILHLKKKPLFFSQFSQFFLSLKYKYTIMCNYLNKYTNLNDAHYIRYTSLWNLYKKIFLICLVYFQNCAAIKKKVTMDSKHTLVQISFIPLAKWTIYASIL